MLKYLRHHCKKADSFSQQSPLNFGRYIQPQQLAVFCMYLYLLYVLCTAVLCTAVLCNIGLCITYQLYVLCICSRYVQLQQLTAVLPTADCIVPANNRLWTSADTYSCNSWLHSCWLPFFAIPKTLSVARKPVFLHQIFYWIIFKSDKLNLTNINPT